MIRSCTHLGFKIAEAEALEPSVQTYVKGDVAGFHEAVLHPVQRIRR